MGNLKLVYKRLLVLVLGVVLTLLMGSSVLALDSAQIQWFTASSNTVQSGETVELSWSVSGATEVQLIGMEREPEWMPLNGTLEVWPMMTTSYVLIAKGADGVAVSKSLTVNVDVKGEVKINEFKASATQVTPGQTVTLSWYASKAVRVKIIGISREDEFFRPIVGSAEVWPEQTTTYLLEATGLNGETVSAAVTVNVVTQVQGQPRILKFKASKTAISQGGFVTLSWSTENAVSCMIRTKSGIKLWNRKSSGYLLVSPKTTETYTLIAYGQNGAKTTSDVTITVK